MILDKLLEKKDILIFLKLRKRQLLHEKQCMIDRGNPRELKKISIINGRIREADYLRILLEQRSREQFNDISKSLYENYGDEI